MRGVVFKLLCDAWESYVQISQINGHRSNVNRRHLAAKVNGVVSASESTLSFRLLDWMMKETAVNLLAIKLGKDEDRRIMWTTF